MKTHAEYVIADVEDHLGNIRRIHLNIRTANGRLMTSRLKKLLKDCCFVSAPDVLYSDMADDLLKRWSDIPPMISELISSAEKKALFDDVAILRSYRSNFNRSQKRSLCMRYFIRREVLLRIVKDIQNTELYKTYINVLKENQALSEQLEKLM